MFNDVFEDGSYCNHWHHRDYRQCWLMRSIQVLQRRNCGWFFRKLKTKKTQGLNRVPKGLTLQQHKQELGISCAYNPPAEIPMTNYRVFLVVKAFKCETNVGWWEQSTLTHISKRGISWPKQPPGNLSHANYLENIKDNYQQASRGQSFSTYLRLRSWST